MTREMVFSWLLEKDQNTQLEAFCKSIDPANHDDLYQEFWCKLLRTGNQITEVHKRGYTLFYCFRVIKSVSLNLKGKKKLDTSDIAEATELQDGTDIEGAVTLSLVSNKIAALYWYDRELFRLYCELGSLREVQKATGIHYLEVLKVINRVRAKLQ